MAWAEHLQANRMGDNALSAVFPEPVLGWESSKRQTELDELDGSTSGPSLRDLSEKSRAFAENQEPSHLLSTSKYITELGANRWGAKTGKEAALPWPLLYPSWLWGLLAEADSGECSYLCNTPTFALGSHLSPGPGRPYALSTCLFPFLSSIKAGFSDILDLESLLTPPPGYKDSKRPSESKKGKRMLCVISELSIVALFSKPFTTDNPGKVVIKQITYFPNSAANRVHCNELLALPGELKCLQSEWPLGTHASTPHSGSARLQVCRAGLPTTRSRPPVMGF